MPAADEVVDLCAELIRFDTSNFGGGDCRGETPAAEWVVARLAEVDVEAQLLESAPGRGNVVARINGTDPAAPGLLVHGPLDVVPAVAEDWSVPPFSGVVRDGCLWGRGTYDMKSTCATTLATVRAMLREGRRPRRDLVLAFTADEEDTGDYGAKFLAEQHAGLFAGVTEGISESGAYTVHAGGRRFYPIAVGERGTAWMRLTATGEAGHGSRPGPDHAVLRLVNALSRLGTYDWPARPSEPVRELIEQAAAALGVPYDPEDLDGTADRLGGMGRFALQALRCTATPTMLEAGYKVNVIPTAAQAHVDARVVPGAEIEFIETLEKLLGEGITYEFVNHENPLLAPHDSPLLEQMSESIQAFEPEARVVPFVMSGGTDAKAFARLGIAGYGFTPLRLPEELPYHSLAHAVDERVPVEGLEFGAQVFEQFIRDL
ncbi:MAG TPA: M20/M25/M40 family metallo-hydrolase [Mycobacteriales bacterium]|nr:M20/M25/M40 family metallo-hydrolase [Mycobacteriales bacterium]